MSAFAALESRLAAVTLGKFTNVTVTINGVAVPAIFDAHAKDVFGSLIEGTAPVLTVPEVVVVRENDPITVNGTAYLVIDITPLSGQKLLKLMESA